jgi:putative transposase
MVDWAGAYRWSSAPAHLAGSDPDRLVDLEWWREYDGVDWRQALCNAGAEPAGELARCTHAGRPFGDEEFVRRLSERFRRHWQRGRPRKVAAAGGDTRQLGLFGQLHG